MADWQRMRWRMDNDALYQAHRMVQTLRDYPDVAVRDEKLHYPEGYHIHWPATYPFMAASLIRPLQPDSLQEVAAIAGWIPVACGLIAIAFWGLAMFRAMRSRWGVLALVALQACAPYVLTHSAFGAIDHHGFVNLCAAMMVYGVIAGSNGLVLGGLALGLATTPEFSFYALVYYAIWAWYRIEVRGRDGVLMVSAVPLVVCVVWGLNGLVAEPNTWSMTNLFELSFLQLGLYVSVALGIAIWSRFPCAHWKMVLRLAGAGAIVLVLVALLVLASSDSLELVTRLGGTGRLGILEERALLGPIGRIPPWVMAFIPVAIACAVQSGVALVREHSLPFARSFAFLLAFVIGLRELRHFAALQGVLIFAAVWAGIEVVRWSRAQMRPTMAPVLAAALMVAGLGLTTLALRGYWRAQRAEFADWWSTDAFVAQWFRDQESGGAVMAPWGLGHQIRVWSGHPVALDPFNFPASQDALIAHVLQASSADALEALMGERDCRFLVVTNPLPTWAELDPELDRDLRATGLPLGACFVPPTLDSHLSRLYLQRALIHPFLRLRAVSSLRDEVIVPAADRSVRVRVPHLAVFERQMGAGLSMSGVDQPVEVDLDVVIGADRVHLHQTLEPDGRGRVMFRTALPAPQPGGPIRVAGPYLLRCGERERQITITAADVEEGVQLNLRFD